MPPYLPVDVPIGTACPQGYGVVVAIGCGHQFRECQAYGGEGVQRVSVVEVGAGSAGEAEDERGVGGEGVDGRG